MQVPKGLVQEGLKSLFSCSSIVSVSFPMYIRQVSSAYNNNSELTARGISFTYKRKVEDPELSLEECHKTTYQGRAFLTSVHIERTMG